MAKKKLGGQTKNYVDPELGEMRPCAKCDEHWPATREFFFSTGPAGRQLMSWCKDCYLEWRKEQRRNGSKRIEERQHGLN